MSQHWLCGTFAGGYQDGIIAAYAVPLLVALWRPGQADVQQVSVGFAESFMRSVGNKDGMSGCHVLTGYFSSCYSCFNYSSSAHACRLTRPLVVWCVVFWVYLDVQLRLTRALQPAHTFFAQFCKRALDGATCMNMHMAALSVFIFAATVIRQHCCSVIKHNPL